MKKLTALALTLAFYCGSASGAVIYDEVLDGDLLGAVDPLTTFNFTVGVNSISGITGYNGEVPDSDSFAFVIPSGTALASASLVVNLAGLSSTNWQFRKGSAALFGGTLLEIVGSSQNFTMTPQLADTYQIYGNSLGGLTGIAGYTFTFNVQSDRGGPEVPEPASMGLLGAGLVAALAIRRR